MPSLKVNKEGLSVYELCFLVLPSIPEGKVPDVVNSVRKLITKEGAVEIDAEAPFKQDLAYSMSKTIGASRYIVSDAYIGWIKFEVDPAKIEAIKADVDKIAEILRSLMVKAPRETTFTFAMARAKIEEREGEKEDPRVSSTEEVPVEGAPATEVIN